MRWGTLPGARTVVTTRVGGLSAPPYDGLNLARHVGDDPGAVEANRAVLRRQIGFPLVFCEQVHSADVITVRTDEAADGIPVRRGDGLVTARTDIALAILVADCMPIALSAPRAGVIGVVHVGRRGLLNGILPAAVRALSELGAARADLRALIGPCACAGCYEVAADMRAEAAAHNPATWSTTRTGTPSLDLRSGALSALDAAGVTADRVRVDPACTLEDPELFSYRRSRRTGRIALVICRV